MRSAALRLEPQPELGTALDAEGESDLSKMIRFGFDFRLILAMRELDILREENKQLRKKLRSRRRRA